MVHAYQAWQSDQWNAVIRVHKVANWTESKLKEGRVVSNAYDVNQVDDCFHLISSSSWLFDKQEPNIGKVEENAWNNNSIQLKICSAWEGDILISSGLEQFSLWSMKHKHQLLL